MGDKISRGLLRFRERTFKALSDCTRLEIIEYLKGGERCVCEIIPYIGRAQSTTSKNLGILFRAGILDKREDGKKTFYRIKNPEIFRLLKDADSLNLTDLASVSETADALRKAIETR
ncbi:MAG TPA: metalloregulator ArsR/SmtB family transcription factor [Candidatus Methanomethylicus sp.]|nr:metalloregulator ArsR/SmtB family transcription factor [Candidatus Methanomethylicus sp.]HRU81033.1 metalloregulator ArsR/SmtB family transcription factor [Candidatus Methanomethylicus sp.]